jgi:hypothetical protein
MTRLLVVIIIFIRFKFNIPDVNLKISNNCDEIRAVEKVTAEVETADAFKLTFPFFDVDELSVQECVITTSKASKSMSFICHYLFVRSITKEKLALYYNLRKHLLKKKGML